MKSTCGSFLGIVVALALLDGCGLAPAARRDRYLARGNTYMQKQDYSRAVLEFKNAVAVMPRDANLYYQLGMAYTGTQDFGAAVAAFRKAIQLNPNHVEARLRIAQMMAATDNEALLKDAQSRLKTLAAAQSASPEILNTLGFTDLKLGNTEAAVQSFERAMTESPGLLGSYIMLARAKLLEKDSKAAEEVLKKACNQLPASSEARRFLGEFYIDQGRMMEAEGQLARALEIDSGNGPALMDLARLQLTRGDKQDAEQNFKRLATFQAYKSVYAIFLFQDGRRDQATREFERLAKESPNDRQARTNLVIAYRAQGRLADADHVLTVALKKDPKDAEALLLRAETSLQATKYDQAEIDLNEVLRELPNSPEVHFLLAKLHQARGNILNYRQELSEALRLNPNLEFIRLELAQNLINDNGAKAALEVLNNAPGAQKSSTALLIERNWALWALGDTEQLRQGIDQALSEGKSADLLIQDGLLKLKSKDFSGARTALEQALKINPSDLRALQLLSQSYAAQKNGSLALQKVEEYAATQPESAPVQDFLGVMLASQGDRSQARAAFLDAQRLDPNSKADLSLTQLDVADGNLADARKRLVALVSKDQDNTIAHLWLGNIDELIGNQEDALQQFRSVVDANPSNAQAANNLAYLLSEQKNNPEEALKYAEKAVELVPDHGPYCDTLGWILYRKGLYASAVKYLERANSEKPTAIWKYHLAMAYAKSGDWARARETLAEALRDNPRLPEAQVAQQLMGNGH